MIGNEVCCGITTSDGIKTLKKTYINKYHVQERVCCVMVEYHKI